MRRPPTSTLFPYTTLFRSQYSLRPRPAENTRSDRTREGNGYSRPDRSEEHTSELQSRFGISYAVFFLKGCGDHRHLPSSPTRRSSDLNILFGRGRLKTHDRIAREKATDILARIDRKSTRLNSSHVSESRMPSSF